MAAAGAANRSTPEPWAARPAAPMAQLAPTVWSALAGQVLRHQLGRYKFDQATWIDWTVPVLQ